MINLKKPCETFITVKHKVTQNVSQDITINVMMISVIEPARYDSIWNANYKLLIDGKTYLITEKDADRILALIKKLGGGTSEQ